MKSNKNDSPFKINEYYEYYDQLTKEEQQFIKQFYREYYMADLYNKDKKNIIKTKEMKSEAIRVHNSLNRDLLNKGYKAGIMDNLDDHDKEFMEEASDSWDLEGHYELHGINFCLKYLINDTKEKLQNKYLDNTLTLARFFGRIVELYKLHKKTGRKNERT